MARKEEIGKIKLQIPAGQANPSPPVGPALGQKGLNIKDFCDKFNAATKDVEKGLPIPVVITAYTDKSFIFETKTPPTSYLVLKYSNLKKGSKTPGSEVVGKIKASAINEIVKIKKQDLKLEDASIFKMVVGTARSMGIIFEE
ncbi:MAG: 50S ribosomal protein L11 [Rickettsiales bacterium]|jgi:large subunit ribosomal protein L11|nr:50S ribosomal protein L11 [Rickettsiales bacterium]